MFPPKETVFTLDTIGDGKPDSLEIKVINVFVPFVIPKEIEIGDFSSKNFNPKDFNISNYGKFLLDDQPLDFSEESFSLDSIKNRILIYHKGESFNLDEVLEGKLAGRTINLKDSISIFIKLDEHSLKKFTKGSHSFKIESDLISNLEIFFELDETNMNIKFSLENA